MRGMLALATAGLIFAAAVISTTRTPAGEPDAPDLAREVAAVSASVAALDRRIELAARDAFYLILKPTARELTLMLRGAELRSFPVAASELGFRRRFLGPRLTMRGWREAIWAEGVLVPARPVEERTLTPSPAGDESLPYIPPTAEDAIPAPARYLVRFPGGLSLEVVREPEAGARGIVDHVRAAARTAWDDMRAEGGRDRIRLRVTMAREDADSLYRSLPPGISLSVEPAAHMAQQPTSRALRDDAWTTLRVQ